MELYPSGLCTCLGHCQAGIKYSYFATTGCMPDEPLINICGSTVFEVVIHTMT